MGISFLNSLVFAFILLLGTFSTQNLYAANINGKVSRLGDAEHLSLEGLSDWDYKIKKEGKNKLRIKISSEFSPIFIKKVRQWKGKYLEKIQIKSRPPIEGDSEIILQLKKNVSYFDYLTDQPSNLVIDFYIEKSKLPKKSVARKKKQKKEVNENEDFTSRKPASTEFIKFDSIIGDINKIIQGEDNNESLIKKGVFDASDPEYKRFTILKKEVDYEKIKDNLKKSVFLNFPVLLRNSSRLNYLLDNIPIHVIRSKNKTETKEAQLLHRLYRAKSWAAFNKMYEYFMKAYPDSKYKNLLNSLATSAYFNTWKLTNNEAFLKKSEDKFLRFKKELPESRVTEYWQKVLFYTNLELNNGMEAARIGEDLVKKYPLASDVDDIRLSLGDAYLKAGQYKRAGQVYENLSMTAKDSKMRKLASFTKPITYIKLKQMNQAVDDYLDKKKEHPNFNEPGYYFNMGEAYFWKGDYYRSASLYKQFIKKFPKHLMNNFAITRIGEIMELMGLAPQRYKPIYFESVYRFGDLKGADIAQIRLHSLNVPRSKKNEADHYIEEIKKIADKYEGNDMKYFRDIIISDSLTNNEEYLASNKYLDRAHKRNPYNSFADKIKPRILTNIKMQVRKYLKDKDYLAAINLFEKNRQSWLSNVKDPEFKKELARSFEMAGMDDYSLAYYVDYAADMNKEDKKLDNQVILSMATLYQKNKNYEEMDKYLNMLSNSNTLSESDKFRTVKLKFEVYEETAAYKNAEKLLKTYQKSIKENNQTKIDATFLLSEFYNDRARYKESLKVLEGLEDLVGENHPSYYELSKRLAKSYVKNGNDAVAMKKVNNVINSESFKKDESFIFFAGNLFVDNNDLKKGKKLWSLLKKEGGVYAKMVNEKLKHEKWMKDYGKFVDRIPAMEDSKKGEY